MTGVVWWYSRLRGKPAGTVQDMWLQRRVWIEYLAFMEEGVATDHVN